MSFIETIELDENNRIVVTTDDCHEWDGDGLTREEIDNLPVPVIVTHYRLYKIVAADMVNAEIKESLEWREIDSIGGCYLDDEYTALVVAREYFGIGE